MMGGRRKGGEVKVETGVGKGGIGGILMARRGRIGGTDRRIDHVADERKGRETGIRIGGSGREAMREEEMTIDHRAGHGSEVTPQTYRDGEGIREIEITTIGGDQNKSVNCTWVDLELFEILPNYQVYGLILYQVLRQHPSHCDRRDQDSRYSWPLLSRCEVSGILLLRMLYQC